jgi:hypothetical protein
MQQQDLLRVWLQGRKSAVKYSNMVMSAESVVILLEKWWKIRVGT